MRDTQPISLIEYNRLMQTGMIIESHSAVPTIYRRTATNRNVTFAYGAIQAASLNVVHDIAKKIFS